MDFDYVEEHRPSLRLQSGGAFSAAEAGDDCNVDRKHAAICIALGMILLFFSAWFQAAGFLQLIAAWLAVSLFLGPFAPISLTAGACRVGQGEIVSPFVAASADSVEIEKRYARSKKNAKSYRAADLVEVDGVKRDDPVKQGLVKPVENGRAKLIEGEWSDEEISLLKKQLAKNPKGTGRRWQVIAECFNGSRTVDDVILKAKSFGMKKAGDEDAYAKFLAERKVSSKQISSDASLRKEFEELDAAAADANGNGNANGNAAAWSDAEDKALLGALKTIPKETAMRWEKIAAVLDGGRSRNQCLKRYAELRDEFRSSKE